MDFDETADFNSDPRTPSGPWEGYWVQGDRLDHMKLDLAFIGRRVIGDGRDTIGTFRLLGTYEEDEGTVVMRKRYEGKHDVWYRGRLVSDGFKGTWTIKDTPARGDWCIWPLIEDEFEITHLEIETENGPIIIHGEVEDDEPEDDEEEDS